MGIGLQKHFAVLAVVTFSQGSLAAELPTAGSIMQQLEQQQMRAKLPTVPAEEEVALPELTPFDEMNSVFISTLVFEGNSAIADEQLLSTLASYTNRKLDYPLMKRLAVEVGEYYRSNGLWAKAILPQQTLSDGVLEYV